MISFIIGIIIVGIIAGAIARLVVPGRQNLSIPATIILGIIGSLVGGLLGALIFQHDLQDGFFQTSGILGSIIGAIIVLLLWVRFGNKSRSRR